MTILNDQIQFTVADFSGLSEPIKKALTGYLGDYAAHFASSLNALAVAAEQHAKNLAAQAPSVNTVLESYAAADSVKRAAAEPLLASLNTLLTS